MNANARDTFNFLIAAKFFFDCSFLVDHLIISACHVNAKVKLAILVPNALHRLKKALCAQWIPVTIMGFLSRDVARCTWFLVIEWYPVPSTVQNCWQSLINYFTIQLQCVGYRNLFGFLQLADCLLIFECFIVTMPHC